MKKTITLFSLFLFLNLHFAEAQVFEPLDIFQLEHISDPQISPDGKHIVYLRNSRDIMTDRTFSNLWIINFDGSNNHPLNSGNHNDSSPRWSPDGKELIYISNKNGSSQIYRRWMATGTEAKLTNLQTSPRNLSWSPDGQWIALNLFVDEKPSSLIQMPKAPKGAKWAAPAVYVDKMTYRRDGGGYVKPGNNQIFILSIEGGTPRQITSGSYNHNGTAAWSTDGKSLIFSANRRDDWEFQASNNEIYEVGIVHNKIRALTDRIGPDNGPIISPDGKLIAYTGYDDKYLGFQQSELFIMNRDGSNPRSLTKELDKGVGGIKWAADGKGLYFQYDYNGNTKIAHVDLDGSMSDLASNIGGLSIGRPYGGGTFSVAKDGSFAFTHSRPDHPSDLAVGKKGASNTQRLTRVNDDLFGHKTLGEVEEIWYESSFDKRRIQGWICKPPNFDPSKKYPLILEIHGGPFANYGDRFSAEVQLFAAAGYVVLYTNPRGSSSYGAEFGNLIHHNYPNEDYFDLISGVDEVIKKGYVDEEQLYVTGGSGGGVLTAWIVGKTDRFRAAVVAKPVINWYSFVLNADGPGFFYKYWFPGLPWDNLEHYMKRSPITYVGNVKTPTMLLTGEKDYRTPISESEQFYAGLKLNKVESALVRIPESGHGIASKPSYLISKVLHILGWFEKYEK